jgi:glucose/arabinose dehydrogenase
VKKFIIIASVVVAVATALILLPRTPAPLPSPEEITDSGIEVVASGLIVPWAIDFADDGRIFLTERIGNVRVIEDGELKEQPVFSTDVAKVGEAGMLGLALDPEFERNHLIYVYYTYVDEKGSLWNRVVRLKEDSNRASLDRILIDKIPGAAIHDGGRIKFGPDKKLYITTGENGNSGLAQDLNSLAGKILRMNPDGTVPDDNPFPSSPVYSYGNRNPQGLAWHPTTGELYATEHGPAGNDEVNIIRPGMNYGWPLEQCAAKNFVEPLICYEISIAPSGATFYSSDKLPYKNHLFFATLRGQHVEHVIFAEDGIRAENFLQGFGRIRDVVEGPDGYLYLATSNRDGRGIPAFDDDKILRITSRYP